MVAVQRPKEREITRAPFLHQSLGEIVVFHDEEGPTIDVTIRPEGTEQYAQFGLVAIEAHQLVDELHRIADIAQRAGWTPAVLDDARAYLPGMTDEQIVERLDRLYRQWEGFVLGSRGRLERRAGRAPAIEVQMETWERPAALVEQHAKTLSGSPDVADRTGPCPSFSPHPCCAMPGRCGTTSPSTTASTSSLLATPASPWSMPTGSYE